MQHDISTFDDIQLMVNEFYEKVQKDPLLSPIFNAVIQNRWAEHLEKMYRFWQTVLLDEHSYQGSPFVPHAKLPLEANHFERWLLLFNETVDLHFVGPKAERAKWQGARMSEMFLAKLSYYRQNPAVSIV
ncbi:MAG: group III truncated hemoglobin [Bacteroidetes bacterium]|nr:MAG: group III truncated hemoglobin [Bacteroidota bacterium]